MNIDGTYNVTMNTPMGPQQGTLTLKANGGSLEGEMAGGQGSLPLEEGKVNGEELSWAVNMTQPMPMKIECTAKIEGDKISGLAQLGAFGTATFEGTRA